MITEEETTAAGFLADQRHQLVIRNEGAVVHMGNKYSSILSPPLHQLPDASLPDGNSGAHQSRCDLVNVGGNTTDTSHTHPLLPMTTLTQVQDDNAFEALTDQDLQAVSGGLIPLLPLIPLIPIAIQEIDRANR